MTNFNETPYDESADAATKAAEFDAQIAQNAAAAAAEKETAEALRIRYEAEEQQGRHRRA